MNSHKSVRPLPATHSKQLSLLITGFIKRLSEHHRLLSWLRSNNCNVKSLYWELPAFAAPVLGQLAHEFTAATEEQGGWLFIDQLALLVACDTKLLTNLVKLVALLQTFTCRQGEGKVICTDAARHQLIRHLKSTGLIPGPLNSLDAPCKAFLGRSLEKKSLVSLITQTTSPGVIVDLDKKIVVFSLDRPPTCYDILLGCLRLWKGPLTLEQLTLQLQKLDNFPYTALEVEMELYGLIANHLVVEQNGNFLLKSTRSNSKYQQNLPQLAQIVFHTLLEIAGSDGEVSCEEIVLIGNLMAVEFQIPTRLIKTFKDLPTPAIDCLSQQSQSVTTELPEILITYPPELRDQLFRCAAAIAIMTQEFHPPQHNLLNRLAENLQTSLPVAAVIERFTQLNCPPHLDGVYFGILPDRGNPEIYHDKFLILHQYYLEKMASSDYPALSEIERLQKLLKAFYSNYPNLPAPWLVSQELPPSAPPATCLIPLHCFLRIASCNGPISNTKMEIIRKLIFHGLSDLRDRALWNLFHLPLDQLDIQVDSPVQPDLRTLSLSLVIALSDGALNVEKSRVIISIASLLKVSEPAFQILPQLERAIRRYLKADPNLEQLDSLCKALAKAEQLSSPPGKHRSSSPLVLPELEPGGHPYLVVIRPSGRQNSIVHLRVRPELMAVPFLQEQMTAAIQQREWLFKQCGEQNWFVCKGVSNYLKLLRELKDSPFEIQWPQGQPFQILSQAGFPNLHASIHKKGGWFEIGGKLQLEHGYQLDLFDVLKRLETSLEVLTVAPNTFVQLDQQLYDQLKQLASLMPEDMQEKTIDPLRTRLLAKHISFFQDATADQEFSHLKRLLLEARTLKVNVPAAIWQQLRDYQKEGVEWLVRTVHAGFGACLADDMGLGKTLQTLCLLYHRRSQGTSLVVAPTSVTYNWKEQAQRFLPKLKVLLYEGVGTVRAQAIEDLHNYHVVITSYGIFHRDHTLLSNYSWNCLVLDEAQKIKNPASATARDAFAMKAQARLATTGTPIENHLLELWSLMNFLNPGLLGSQNHFRQTYLSRSNDDQEARRMQRLRGQILHFILRRRKNMVAPQLPPKLETIYRIDLSPPERNFYNQIRQTALTMQQKDRISLLAALTRLRQACCDPGLVDEQWSELSSKLSAAVEILSEVSGEGHQILVFSQFVSLLQRLAHHLEAEQLTYRTLYGSTSVTERRSLVEKFQQGDFPIFLISLKAGGTGLTLTRADYILHLDPWWNPAVEDQATDRAHRIGQTQTVNVYRLIARETVEEKVLELHQSKRQLAQSLLDEDGSPSLLTLEDLQALL